MRKYYDSQATSGGGGEQPEERITNLPFKQPFEDFEGLRVFIQQMASSGMVPHGSGWTSFLYELNKVCSAARLSDKQQPEEQDIPGQWIVKSHSYQIADTGDYDGHYELTNGKISIFTLDDTEDGYLEKVATAMNESGCKFYLDDSNESLYYHEKANRELLERELAELRLSQKKEPVLPRWVKADTVDLDMILRPVLAKRVDDETVMGRGVFQKSDGTFFWYEEGFVPVSKKDHSKLLLLEESLPHI